MFFAIVFHSIDCQWTNYLGQIEVHQGALQCNVHHIFQSLEERRGMQWKLNLIYLFIYLLNNYDGNAVKCNVCIYRDIDMYSVSIRDLFIVWFSPLFQLSTEKFDIY